MAQAQVFGTFIFNEDDHVWSLDLGFDLARWLFITVIHGPCDCNEASIPAACRTDIDQYEESINRRLETHSIDYVVSYDRLRYSSPEQLHQSLAEANTEVMTRLRLEKSASHLAFALFAGASYFYSISGHEALPEIAFTLRENFHRLAGTYPDTIRKIFCDRFPLGFDKDAIVTIIKGSGGSMRQLRQILLDLQQPIVILLVLADSRDQKRLQLLEEVQQLTESLDATEFHNTFQIRVLANPRPDNFAKYLTKMKPKIVHFSGHELGHGLASTDHMGNTVDIPPDRLARTLGSARRCGLKAVVMNSCYTADQAGVIADAVRDVVLMQRVLDDPAGIRFATDLYAQLGHGRSFKDAFVWARDSDLVGVGTLDARLISKADV